MELISKVISPLTHFWVEKYNKKAKEFFLNLGFVEVEYSGFKPEFKLEFKGTGTFGWSDEEQKKIFDAVQTIPLNQFKELDYNGLTYKYIPN
jgi:hypothetical protein